MYKKPPVNNQFVELPNQSLFHEKMRSILRTDALFREMTCLQEVQVRSIIPSYGVSTHHYDWYIKEMGVVIELHGRQHYHRTNFGSTGYEASVKAFEGIRRRERIKRRAAIDAGYIYVEVPYTMKDDLTAVILLQLIEEQSYE